MEDSEIRLAARRSRVRSSGAGAGAKYGRGNADADFAMRNDVEREVEDGGWRIEEHG